MEEEKEVTIVVVLIELLGGTKGVGGHATSLAISDVYPIGPGQEASRETIKNPRGIELSLSLYYCSDISTLKTTDFVSPSSVLSPFFVWQTRKRKEYKEREYRQERDKNFKT